MERQKTQKNQKQCWKRRTKLNDDTTQLQDSLESSSNQDYVVLQKNRQTDQWKRTERQEINRYKYSQLIFGQYNGAKTVFLTAGAGTTGHPYTLHKN